MSNYIVGNTAAFLLCDANCSVLHTSEALRTLLELPGIRTATTRDLIGLLNTSAVLQVGSLERHMPAVRNLGLQVGEYQLETETEAAPVKLRVERAGELHWVLTFSSAERENQLRLDLVELAHSDPLTKLHNRRHLQQVVWAAIGAGEACPAVMILDLDRFKAVNDTLGHPIGDQLLRKVAERLRTVITPDATLARLGGDEFAVFYPQGATANLQHVSAKIVDLLSRPFLIEGHQVNIGTSIGIAFTSDGNVAYERLMKCADLALYEAKAAGRGSFRFFRQEMEDAARERRLIELDLRKSLALRQFQVRYRPRVDVETGLAVGIQTSLRWNHPQRGSLDEEAFMPLAEEISLKAQVGNWLIKTACQEAALLPNNLSVSVCVSSAQFTGREPLVEVVAQSLRASRLSPDRLEIGITEDVLFKHEDTVVKILLALRALGVRVVMNEFGLGYASLSKLVSFPFDRVTLASSFVHETWSASHRAIVQAVATLGTSLGIATLLDGVETQEELAQVRQEGGSSLQGCRLEPSLSSTELAAILQHSLA